MSYIEEEALEERLNRYQRLKKEGRNEVEKTARIMTELQKLENDSVDQVEKDEVIALRVTFVDAMVVRLGFSPTA